MTVSLEVPFDYLMGDDSLKINRQLRENEFMGGEIVKVTEAANISYWEKRTIFCQFLMWSPAFSLKLISVYIPSVLPKNRGG